MFVITGAAKLRSNSRGIIGRGEQGEIVHARKAFILPTRKHEKEAIYEVNERNSNVCRLRSSKAAEQFAGHHR